MRKAGLTNMELGFKVMLGAPSSYFAEQVTRVERRVTMKMGSGDRILPNSDGGPQPLYR